MMGRRHRDEVAQLVAQRRRREDEAPRLAAEVPRLASLHLEIDERRPGAVLAGGAHVRRIVVERAPALFVMRCGGPECSEGVHDLTGAVMRSLHTGAARFEGECGCDGCACVLRYVGVAAYRA
jgi:hypothetical protein